MDFTDKVVVITGASAGIGAACALKFAQLSAKLSLIGRNECKLHEVASMCEEAAKVKPLTIKADITNDVDVKGIIDKTLEYFGKIDVLVNNAGTTCNGGLEAGVEELDRIMSTNIRGAYLLTSLAVPYIIKTKGNIINISSAVAVRPNTLLLPYCMSKAAMDSFTQCLALQLGPQGVRVNSINPGPVKTDIFKRGGMSDEENSRLFETLAATLPLRQVSESDEVADLVVYLASHRAKSITGSRYLIDCGYSLGQDVVY